MKIFLIALNILFGIFFVLSLGHLFFDMITDHRRKKAAQKMTEESILRINLGGK